MEELGKKVTEVRIAPTSRLEEIPFAVERYFIENILGFEWCLLTDKSSIFDFDEESQQRVREYFEDSLYTGKLDNVVDLLEFLSLPIKTFNKPIDKQLQ